MALGPGRALVLSCHPLPAAAVSLLVVGLLALAGSAPGRGLTVAAAIFLGQLSIGWSNDAHDAERDAASGRTDKPVATGAISAHSVMAFAGIAYAASVALVVPAGPTVLSLVVIGGACGWVYNFWAKFTALSWVPFAVAFGLLPAVATCSSTDGRWPAAWAIVAGALFGVSAHVTNVLPDLLDDEATGVRGLPHRIGARASAIAGPTLLFLASVAILLGAPGQGSVRPAVGLIISGAVAVWAASSAVRAPGSRRYFFAVIIIAALDVLLFATSGAGLD